MSTVVVVAVVVVVVVAAVVAVAVVVVVAFVVAAQRVTHKPQVDIRSKREENCCFFKPGASLEWVMSIAGQNQQFDCFLWRQRWPWLQPLLVLIVVNTGAAENADLPNYGQEWVAGGS